MGGYDQVLTTTSYSASLGYGWQSGGLLAVDRGGDPLVGDLIYAQALTFAVDVPEGAYEVILTMGDRGPYAHESMGVFLEDQQIDTVSTAPGEMATFTYNDVAVAGGKFELRLLDLGGPDVNAVLAGLELSAHVDLGDFEDRDTLAADFDGDGFITGFDFLAWQRGLGTIAPNATKTDGDADNDLDVDSSDLGVWELQYGTQSAPQVAALEAPVAESHTQSTESQTLLTPLLVDLAMMMDKPRAALDSNRTEVEQPKPYLEVAPDSVSEAPTPLPQQDTAQPATVSGASVEEERATEEDVAILLELVFSEL